MWLVYLALVAGWSGHTALAFPQNEVGSDGNGDAFEVDGFVFDGPADRPLTGPVRGSTSSEISATPTTVAAATMTTTTAATTTTTTTTAVPDSQFNACVTRCPVTTEYNPVCGSDNVDYDNPGRLSCASVCGKGVTLRYYGRCVNASFRGR